MRSEAPALGFLPNVAFVALVPAVLLLGGAVARVGIQPAGAPELRAPLATLPERVDGYRAVSTRELTEAELRVLRPDDYALREYEAPKGEGGFTLFVAWYGRQTSGATIHSPRNCLPGAGWQAAAHERVTVPTPYGPGRVNRYLVEHESGARALVYYWYQGRGRVAASEYAVKWHLVRDAILERRTDEALVRLVFPLGRRSESPAPDDAYRRAVVEVIDRVAAHLPS